MIELDILFDFFGNKPFLFWVMAQIHKNYFRNRKVETYTFKKYTFEGVKTFFRNIKIPILGFVKKLFK